MFRALHIRYLLTYLLTYFDMYDHLGYTKTTVFSDVHCVQKNTHSHFLSYLHELFVDLKENCSEYTQWLIDSDNAKIRYSLQSMT